MKSNFGLVFSGVLLEIVFLVATLNQKQSSYCIRYAYSFSIETFVSFGGMVGFLIGFAKYRLCKYYWLVPECFCTNVFGVSQFNIIIIFYQHRQNTTLILSNAIR
jgi:hypothetical protein